MHSGQVVSILVYSDSGKYLISCVPISLLRCIKNYYLIIVCIMLPAMQYIFKNH